MSCTFELTFNGRASDRGIINYYDVAQALAGFERTISLTTHLLLNGEVMTQSPRTKGFQLLALPPEDGSWKFRAVLLLGTTLGAFGVAPPDTQFGWLAKSAVSYVIEEALGFEPNF